MNKPQRHFVIKEIILSQPVGSQEELAALLKKRGFEATQATLSRDLAELGVARIHSGDGLRYSLNPAVEDQKVTPLVVREVLSISHNEVMIVIKTLPGRASGVASYLDSLKNPNIIGTVAGDDTVFITPASVKKISVLEKLIKEILFAQ
ncbi:MAG: arginine repressor [Bacteroidota bacterium]|jgi:transcriptional regulator of arginine metabolism